MTKIDRRSFIVRTGSVLGVRTVTSSLKLPLQVAETSNSTAADGLVGSEGCALKADALSN